MNRHTRLTRKTPLQRETRLRPMSDKKRKEKRETDGPRREFAVRVGGCMDCGRVDPVEVHEITGGPNRHKAVYHERLQVVLCRSCHERWHDKAVYPPARQLAIRILWEMAETVCEYEDVSGRRMSLGEVVQWMLED